MPLQLDRRRQTLAFAATIMIILRRTTSCTLSLKPIGPVVTHKHMGAKEVPLRNLKLALPHDIHTRRKHRPLYLLAAIATIDIPYPPAKYQISSLLEGS